jgi:adenosine deaminase/adenosine deaminase CECR1
MKLSVSLCRVFSCAASLNAVYSGSTDATLKIRNNEAQLTAFSPNVKGRLHHHFSGSIYAEPLLKHAIAQDFYLNMKQWMCERKNQQLETGSFFGKSNGTLDVYKQKSWKNGL